MKPAALAPSPLDSARFGLRVGRAMLEGVDAKALARQIIAEEYDVCILRMPVGMGGDAARLAHWALPVVHADTLVYYRCNLESVTPQPLRNGDLEFSLATPDDLPEVSALVAETFRDYVSHYHANPLFNADHILEGYREWALSHAHAPATSLFVARRSGRLIAFAACREDETELVAEGVLYGVSPTVTGGGVYGDLIRHTQAHSKARGMRTMLVSTQVQNYAVQKVWAREGFHLHQAYDTFHVNAVLGGGQVLFDGPMMFSAEHIRNFAELTGDSNPLHLDHSAARAAGFASPIAHGVLAATELSRLLGMEVPGPGTVISRLELAFLKPILADTQYRLLVRAPGGLRVATSMEVVATVTGHDGQTCLLARSDVLVRR